MASQDAQRSDGGSPQDVTVKPPPLPTTFVLELTQRCNNRCGYCYNAWRAPDLEYPKAGSNEMTLGQIEQAIIKLRSETQLDVIALSGGEPTLRPDFKEIVQLIHSFGIKTQIITNGTHLSESLVEATAQGSVYQVSLLSSRAEVHDRLTGHQGAWDAVIDGMLNVHLAGGHLIAVFVATRENFADLGPTVHLAIMLGAASLLYNRINVGGSNLRNPDALSMTPAMVEKNLRTLDEIAVTTGFSINTGVVIEPCMVDVSRYPHIHHGWCSLAGEHATPIIDPAGNIRICEHSPTILGHIERDSIRDILTSHPYVQAFRTTWPEECAGCDQPLRDLCQGGCRAAAEQAYGCLTRADPFVRRHA
ncbi:MAG: radical SAM protein [Candidatus Thiodiazotropha sp.]|jgi:PqqA peptide cyclase